MGVEVSLALLASLGTLYLILGCLDTRAVSTLTVSYYVAFRDYDIPGGLFFIEGKLRRSRSRGERRLGEDSEEWRGNQLGCNVRKKKKNFMSS